MPPCLSSPSRYDKCAAAEEHGAPHALMCDMDTTTSCPSPQPRRIPPQTTSCACMPVVGSHIALGSAVPSGLPQPTFAWLIAAPLPNSARTHSTWPFWLAIHSAVVPVVCNSAQYTQSAQHAVTPAITISIRHVCHSRGARCSPSPQVRHGLDHFLNSVEAQRILPHTPRQCNAIEFTQPTEAWLIATPSPNSARTHSTCPFSLAMCSGVQPVVCHTTEHENRTHHAVMPAITISI
jgi:hypothetical protein